MNRELKTKMDMNKLYEEKGKLTTSIEIAQQRLQMINAELSKAMQAAQANQAKGVEKDPEKPEKPKDL